MTRLLVCSQEPLGGRMTGPAIRAVELAEAARGSAEVRLAAPAGGDVPFHPHDPGPLRAALRDADAVLTPPLWPRLVAAVRASGVAWCCDLSAPEPLETLEHFRDRPRLRRLMSALAADRLDDALAHASVLVCATETQRDLYTGALLAARGLRPAVYDTDTALHRRFAIVPFGMPAAPPTPAGHPLRERFGIGRETPVVVWNGGTWPWFDPAAAVEAVLAHPAAHLVFMGGADERVVRGPRVHVNTEWVPYADRGAWLLDADAAITTHHDHVETRYAFRTRILDALWAGLPVICTGGDDLAARIAREDLGAVADPSTLAAAVRRVLDAGRASYAARIAATQASLTWPVVAQPLLDAIAAPPAPAGSRAAHPARAARTLAYRAASAALGRRRPTISPT